MESRRFRTKMMRSKAIARFHHLYLVQVLVEIQRHCNQLYSRIKQKVLVLMSKKLHLNSKLRFMLNSNRKSRSSNNQNAQDYYSCVNYDDYMSQHQEQIPGMLSNSTLNGGLFEDLNQLLLNQSKLSGNSAVSIPMQMLLLPLMVQQPHGLINGSDVRGKKPTIANNTSHMCSSSNNNNKDHRQQRHETVIRSSCALSQFVTLVPSQMIPAQAHSFIAPSNEQHYRRCLSHKDSNQIQFASRRQDDLSIQGSLQSNGQNASSTWSTFAARDDSRRSSARSLLEVGGNHVNHSCGLTMRNPLMSFATTAASSKRQP